MSPWWPSARTSALPSKTQNRWLALARLRRETSPADPAKGIGCAAGCHERLLPGQNTRACYVLIPPQCRIPLAREPSALSLRRLIAYASSSVVGLRRLGVLNITASCVPSGCFTVTLTAPRIPHPARGCPRRVAVTAPARRHPSRQRRRFASKGTAGSARPKPPPNPNARPLPSPRGRRREIVGSLRSKMGKRFFVSAASFSGRPFSALHCVFCPSPFTTRAEPPALPRGSALQKVATSGRAGLAARQ